MIGSMTRIRLNPQSDPAAALATVRDTFVSRGYHWEPRGDLEAVASEGGEPVRNTALSQKLKVVAEVDPRKNRVVLKQKTVGAAYAGNGVPFFTVRLTMRFSTIAKSVRQDLEAAGL
jgi:hypothetical protein